MIKIHLSVGGVVVGPHGKIVVVNQNGDSWSLPKGHLDPGETALQAAKREISEEAGIEELQLIGSLGTYTRTRLARGGGEDKTQKKRLTFFLFRTNQTRLKPKDPANPQARWVEPQKVTAMLTHPRDRVFFGKAWVKSSKLLRSSNCCWKSPAGWLQIQLAKDKITSVRFCSKKHPGMRTAPIKIQSLLRRFFYGDEQNIKNHILFPRGTSFQELVWHELLKIPRGKTVTYAEIARRIKRPRATRAVGSAVGANPLCVIIPCHRVLASNGGLGGYAYGLKIKTALLKLEDIQL